MMGPQPCPRGSSWVFSFFRGKSGVKGWEKCFFLVLLGGKSVFFGETVDFFQEMVVNDGI